MRKARRSASRARPRKDVGKQAGRLALGYLALLPLLLAYEAAGGPSRNVAEVVLSLPLAPLGRAGRWIRLGLLLLLAACAAWCLFRQSLAARASPEAQRGLLPRLARIPLEGALAALLLGPGLLLLSSALGAEPAAEDLAFARTGTGLSRAADLAGGAAWEEILFRIIAQGLVFVLASHTLGFLTESAPFVRAGAGVVSVAAGALFFAAAHLSVFTQLLGSGGEAFHPAIFTWRVAAGILLGALYRWRGAGVAAWAHALFDICLSIGAGPDVFL